MKLNQILFSINFPDSILMVSLKGYSTPKLKYIVIIHLPAHRFNSLKALFIFGTQIKII